MPTNIDYHPILTNEAHQLADIALAKTDLNRSLGFCDALQKIDPLSANIVMQEALSISIAITYARAHKLIGAKTLSCQILQLNPSQSKLHDELIFYRNKHIAHSVSTLDLYHVCAEIVKKGTNLKFKSISLRGKSEVPTFACGGLNQIIDLIKYEVDKLNEEIQNRTQALTNHFHNIDVQDIIKNGPIPNAFGKLKIKPKSKKNLKYKIKSTHDHTS